MPRILLALSLFACTTDAVDPLDPGPGVERVPPPVGPQALTNAEHATGSNSIIGVGGFVFTADRDAGTLTRLDPVTGATASLDLGVEPSRITAVDDSLYVTLRGERSVVKVSASQFAIVGRAEVGAEPIGVVAREDGTRIYVAVSQQDQVVELDSDLNELGRFAVPGEPKGLALHPSGATLYVGLARGAAGLAALDLIDGRVSSIGLPPTTRGDRALKGRVSGDPVVLAGGDKVAVPVLYLDTLQPIPSMSSPEDVVDLPPLQESPYGGAADKLGKVSPSVVEVDVGVEGQAGASRALFIGHSEFVNSPNGAFDASAPNAGFGIQFSRSVTGYISSIVVAPDGRYLAAMEGAGVAALIDPSVEIFSGDVFDTDGLPPFDQDGDGIPDMPAVDSLPSENGFVPVGVAVMHAGPGADGVALLGDVAVSNNRFAGSATVLNLAAADTELDQTSLNGINAVGVLPILTTWATSESTLSAEVALGRNLFFSTRNEAMGGGGVSCSSCHVDGRTDGVTWTFDDGPLQTPSLAGRVSDTQPVTWRSDVASVRNEADITTRGRMGGHGLTETELDAVAAYVDWTRLPDTPEQGLISDSSMRGAALYEQAGCAGCHAGQALTDNDSYPIRGIELNTPPLRGVAATAPYLHDGGAATLRDVLELARENQMGSAAGWSDAQLDDLVAYLRTL